MKKLVKTGLCSALLVASTLFSQHAVEAGSKLNMSYLYFGTTDTLVSQVDQTKQALNRVSPPFFELSPEGNLKPSDDVSEFVKEMHARSLNVVPFLTNHWDRQTGRNALANKEALASQVADAIASYNLDGVNLDMENMTEQDRDSYSEFVRILREKLPPNKEISVCIAANPNGWSKGWQASYDLEQLARYSDFLMIMTYDQHWGGGRQAGPVAGLPWVEKSVQQALRYVAPDKLVLGIPFYGRYWTSDGTVLGAGISNKLAEGLLACYQLVPQYDETEQAPFFTFTVGAGSQPPIVNSRKLEPGTYTVWYENERSIKGKLSLVRKYNLRGVGSWSLSQETPDTWNYFAKWLEGNVFADTEVHWAKQDVEAVLEKGWMTGTTSSLFSPDAPLTRAQAAAILARALRLADKTGAEGGLPLAESFRDVPDTYWGKTEIGLARTYGLIDGFEDGTFGPEQPVTREQLATMASRALGYDTNVAADGASGPFIDVNLSRWSCAAIWAMKLRNTLQGYEDGAFHPEMTASRAEMAALMNRTAADFELRADQTTK